MRNSPGPYWDLCDREVYASRMEYFERKALKSSKRIEARDYLRYAMDTYLLQRQRMNNAGFLDEKGQAILEPTGKVRGTTPGGRRDLSREEEALLRAEQNLLFEAKCQRVLKASMSPSSLRVRSGPLTFPEASTSTSRPRARPSWTPQLEKGCLVPWPWARSERPWGAQSPASSH